MEETRMMIVKFYLGKYPIQGRFKKIPAQIMTKLRVLLVEERCCDNKERRLNLLFGEIAKKYATNRPTGEGKVGK